VDQEHERMETQDQDFFGKLNLSLSALEKLEVSYVLGVGMGTAVGAHKQVRVGALQEGFNKGVALLGKVLQTVPHENSVPLYVPCSHVLPHACYLL
jgi:hypothetical protein